VLKEISYAQKNRKTIIPVMASPTEAPFALNDLQYIDFTLPGLGLPDLVAAIMEEIRPGGEILAKLNQVTRAALNDDPRFEWRFVRGSGAILVTLNGKAFAVPDFFMAKTPTTNRQYQAFIQAPDGYPDPRWWDDSESARAWRAKHPQATPTAFIGDDLPRTRVSWYDSLAFTRWLDWKIKQLSPSPNPKICLPTEWEWEWAASRDSGRQYPWGDELSADRANYGGDVGQASPVAAYAQGASPDGLLDMAGNVWEWCLNDYETLALAPSKRQDNSRCALRGGSWAVKNPRSLRADFRFSFRPTYEFHDQGFRCLAQV
jgi:formylglycine-generating enzyme required for sulfatase activity